MIARLMAINIIKGNYVYSRVPEALKQQVRNELEQLGHGNLAVD